MATDPLPQWFYECYDSIKMHVPVCEAASIRQIPLYIRFRYRLVNELLKESQIKSAVKAKAQGVIDFSSL